MKILLLVLLGVAIAVVVFLNVYKPQSKSLISRITSGGKVPGKNNVYDLRVEGMKKSDELGYLIQPFAYNWGPYSNNAYRFTDWTSGRPNFWPDLKRLPKSALNVAIPVNNITCEWDIFQSDVCDAVRCNAFPDGQELIPTSPSDMQCSVYRQNRDTVEGRIDNKIFSYQFRRQDFLQPRHVQGNVFPVVAPYSYRINYLLHVYPMMKAQDLVEAGLIKNLPEKDGFFKSEDNKKSFDQFWESLASFIIEYALQEGLTSQNCQFGGGRPIKKGGYGWPDEFILSFAYNYRLPENNSLATAWFGAPMGNEGRITNWFSVFDSLYSKQLMSVNLKNQVNAVTEWLPLSELQGKSGLTPITKPGDYPIQKFIDQGLDGVSAWKFNQLNYMEVTRTGTLAAWIDPLSWNYEGSYGYCSKGNGLFFPMRGMEGGKKGEMMVACNKFHACLMSGISLPEACQYSSGVWNPIGMIACRLRGGIDGVKSSGGILAEYMNPKVSKTAPDYFKNAIANIFYTGGIDPYINLNDTFFTTYYDKENGVMKDDVFNMLNDPKMGAGFNGWKEGEKSIIKLCREVNPKDLANDNLFMQAAGIFALQNALGIYTQPVYNSPVDFWGYPADQGYFASYTRGILPWVCQYWYISGQKRPILQGEPAVDKTHFFSLACERNGVPKTLNINKIGETTGPKDKRIDTVITLLEGQGNQAAGTMAIGQVDTEMQFMRPLPEMSRHFCFLNPIWVDQNRYGLYNYDDGTCQFCVCETSCGIASDGTTLCKNSLNIQIGSTLSKSFWLDPKGKGFPDRNTSGLRVPPKTQCDIGYNKCNI